MRDRLALPGEVYKELAKFICATYWDGKRALSNEQLNRFSNELPLVSQILSYDQGPEDQAELYILASWCRAEFQLLEWDDRA